MKSMVEISCFLVLKTEMKYTVNKVFTEEECEQILTTCMKEGEKFYYTEEEANSWDCRRIHQKAFKEYILEKLNINHTFGTLKIKDIIISLTKYYDNRRLDLHLDRISNQTIVIPLTKGYEDGRFVLSSTQCLLSEAEVKLNLGIGEGVIFEGNSIYHGVMPVHTGERSALNIWIDGVNKNKLL